MRQILVITLLVTAIFLSSCAGGGNGTTPVPTTKATPLPSPTENAALTEIKNQSGKQERALRLILKTLLANLAIEIASIDRKIESNTAKVAEINRQLPTLHDQKLKDKTNEKISLESETPRLTTTKTQLTDKQRELTTALQALGLATSTQ